MGLIDSFGYLGDCIPPGDPTSDELFSCILKVPFALTSLRHPVVDQRLGIHSSNKVGSVTGLRSMTVEDISAKILSVFVVLVE